MKFQKINTKSRQRKNFTLVEVIVVIVIIALLATIAVPNFMSYLRKANITAAKVQIKNFVAAIEAYKLENGSIPDASNGLEALIKNPGDSETWGGPYLKVKTIPKDPWGQDYIYNVPGNDGSEFSIISYGSDKQEGGSGEAADITSD